MLLLLIKARRQTHHQGKPTRSWLIESERSVTRSALCLASSKPSSKASRAGNSHLVDVGVEDLVHEAYTRRLEWILIRQLDVNLPHTLLERSWNKTEGGRQSIELKTEKERAETYSLSDHGIERRTPVDGEEVGRQSVVRLELKARQSPRTGALSIAAVGRCRPLSHPSRAPTSVCLRSCS